MCRVVYDEGYVCDNCIIFLASMASIWILINYPYIYISKTLLSSLKYDYVTVNTTISYIQHQSITQDNSNNYIYTSPLCYVEDVEVVYDMIFTLGRGVCLDEIAGLIRVSELDYCLGIWCLLWCCGDLVLLNWYVNLKIKRWWVLNVIYGYTSGDVWSRRVDYVSYGCYFNIPDVCFLF